VSDRSGLRNVTPADVCVNFAGALVGRRWVCVFLSMAAFGFDGAIFAMVVFAVNGFRGTRFSQSGAITGGVLIRLGSGNSPPPFAIFRAGC
jgi:hypothetical protein